MHSLSTNESARHSRQSLAPERVLVVGVRLSLSPTFTSPRDLLCLLVLCSTPTTVLPSIPSTSSPGQLASRCPPSTSSRSVCLPVSPPHRLSRLLLVLERSSRCVLLPSHNPRKPALTRTAHSSFDSLAPLCVCRTANTHSYRLCRYLSHLPAHLRPPRRAITPHDAPFVMLRNLLANPSCPWLRLLRLAMARIGWQQVQHRMEPGHDGQVDQLRDPGASALPRLSWRKSRMNGPTDSRSMLSCSS